MEGQRTPLLLDFFQFTLAVTLLRHRAQTLPWTSPRNVGVDYKDQAAFGSIAVDVFGTIRFSA